MTEQVDVAAEKVSQLFELTRIPIVWDDSAEAIENSNLRLADDRVPSHFVLPTLTDETRIITALHELGHFADWPKLSNPMVFNAYRNAATRFPNAVEWRSMLAAEVRAWQNAILVCEAEELLFPPCCWAERVSRLRTYYDLWEEYEDSPCSTIRHWARKLLFSVESLCPGVLAIMDMSGMF